MKLMHIDCGMGAAGDMLTGALLDLLSEEERKAFTEEFNSLGLPGVEMLTEPSVKCGVRGTHVKIKVYGEEEGTAAHTHDITTDTAGHHHRGPDDIKRIVCDVADIPVKVRDDILRVYQLIGDAESRAHGVPVSQIHFHEVGDLDAIADITAVCLLMDRFKADRISASPVNTGSGTVECAHGLLPVPAPATACILEGIPSYQGDIKNELCTPTGAALLKHFATEFGQPPAMTEERFGYGMGTKDFPLPNCVKITLGVSD